MKTSINYFAVIVAALACLAISYVWFTILFRAPYLEGLGKTSEQLNRGPSVLEASAMQVAGNIVMAVALAWLIKNLGYQTALQGMQLGAVIWLGFVAAVIGPLYAYQAFSLQFFFITTGAVLVSLLVMGAILGAWH
ncbi:MAG: DUF1761 domain-containing protein [Rhizobacter sp.]|nr:DUF1761 domain-containing protein [Chlorobiales bacterium]